MAIPPAIPTDVVGKIFLRLPIKSLVRFLAGQKPWKSLILDKTFARDHQTRNAAENPGDYDCVICHKDQLSILYHDKETIICPSDEYTLQLVGCIAGLVCLRKGHKFSLWNPALHQSIEFSLPQDFVDILDNVNQENEEHCLDFADIKIAGLGFDPTAYDYKVVVCYELPKSTDLGIVYSTKYAVWTRIGVPDSLFLPDSLFGNNVSDRTSPCVTTSSCPYWANWTSMQGDYKKFRYLHVVKFNVKNDKFMCLPPFCSNRVDGEAHYQFTSMKDRLTVLGFELKGRTCPELGVYCLDKEEDSGVWTYMYKLGPINVDGVRGRWSLLQGFKSGDEIVIEDPGRDRAGRYLLYDVESETRKLLKGTTTGEVRSCYSYTPTLAFIPGMSSVYTDTQNSAIGSLNRFPWRLIHSLDYLSDEEEKDDYSFESGPGV